MKLIATHNSVTGEAGAWPSLLLTPFARCQTKTLTEQYIAGCRIFDIRVVQHKGKYYGAHGLWRTKQKLYWLLSKLDKIAQGDTYLTVTYEGRIKTEQEKRDLINYYNFLKRSFPYLSFRGLNAKYTDAGLTVDWVSLLQDGGLPNNKQAFLPLDGRHWQTFIPIPWLWQKIYFPHVTFNEEYYQFVDFL